MFEMFVMILSHCFLCIFSSASFGESRVCGLSTTIRGRISSSVLMSSLIILMKKVHSALEMAT